jgi:hypothetical protein
MNDSPPSPARTFDQIRDGAAQILVVARQRLADCELAITEGRFSDAHDRAQELLARLGPLASAETYLGGFDDSFIVRASDVEEGMLLKGWGRVTGKQIEHKGTPGAECVHVLLRFEDGEDRELHAEQEIVAHRAE